MEVLTMPGAFALGSFLFSVSCFTPVFSRVFLAALFS
jgi:hypothetical protein